MSKFSYAEVLSTKPHNTQTPQTQPIRGREKDMAPNNAGGFSFKLDEWGYLDRFLILGSDSPTYYASAQKLTKDASKNAINAIALDGQRAVARIVEISQGGRAPKNDSAIVALALAATLGDAETVKAAYEALPKVCRIGTHLFQFVNLLDEIGKWNAAAKRGIAKWYNDRSIERLAVQLLKYQQRDGWSHTDVLRLAHVKPKDAAHSALYRYVIKGAETLIGGDGVPDLIYAYEALKKDPTKAQALRTIAQFGDAFTWEMLPTELHRDPDIMSAMLPNMGVTALIRKLGQLTDIGVIKGSSVDTKTVINRLTDRDLIKAGRVHPITLLMAVRQYGAGHGDKGSLRWTPVRSVQDALQDAFYEAFDYVETTGQGYMFGLDISGSMFGGQVTGAPGLYPAEVSAVMALAVAKRESNYEMFGFDTRPKPLKISPTMRLEDVIQAMKNLRWSSGGTDCSLPMTYALDNKLNGVDKFCVYTDSETYAGRMQPVEALARYRKTYNPEAKLIVCGTSTTGFTIADPKDPGMLDIVGFDSAAPQLIQTF